MGTHNRKTSPTMQAIHIPRVVKLVTENPGLTKSKLYSLRPFDFGLKSMGVILGCAKNKGLIVKDMYMIGKEARWYPASNDLNKEKE